MRVGSMAAAVLAASLAASASAATEEAKVPPAEKLDIPFEMYTLPNGLEVMLHQDRRVPLVAVSVWYHVGAYHERPGRSGFAHLFEHMMFQGSSHVGDDKHFELLEQIGATGINGTTSFDRTNYFETVPSNYLETALWLESDRMGFLLPALTQEKLDVQKAVVKNERRQSTENRPYGLADEKLWHALFPEGHPYHGMVIGSMEDLEAATVEDVKDFFETWYAPSNATLVVAGDFEVAEAKALVERYFGSFPTRPEPKAAEVEPVRLDSEVVIRHDEQVASLPKVELAWHSPPIYQPGDADLDVLAAVLSSGVSSRLHRRLVRELQIAQSVSAAQSSLGAQSVFFIEAVGRPGTDPQRLVDEIDAVLAQLRDQPVSADEVRRAVDRYETSFFAGLQMLGSFNGRAEQLQRYNHYVGRPDWITQDLARYHAVTPESVRQAARQILDPRRRAVLIAVPQDGQAEARPQAARPATEGADR